MPVNEVSHPLIQNHLSRLRDASTGPAEFRLLIQRLAVLLAYEATKDLIVEEFEVPTPLTTATGHRLRQRIGLIPILRAGLGMVDPLLNLLPAAEVWHLGLYRDEATAQPVEYYSKIAETGPVDVALILDPMLATGGSAGSALEALRHRGIPAVKLLSVIASRAGSARSSRNILKRRSTYVPSILILMHKILLCRDSAMRGIVSLIRHNKNA